MHNSAYSTASSRGDATDAANQLRPLAPLSRVCCERRRGLCGEEAGKNGAEEGLPEVAWELGSGDGLDGLDWIGLDYSAVRASEGGEE